MDVSHSNIEYSSGRGSDWRLAFPSNIHPRGARLLFDIQISHIHLGRDLLCDIDSTFEIHLRCAW